MSHYKDDLHVFTVSFIVLPDTKMQYQDVHEHTYGGAGEFIRTLSKQLQVKSIAYKEYWGPSGLINGERKFP